MEKIIEFKNTNFAYDNLNAFNDFNMEIEKGDIVTLIGPSGSGKSTILKMLCHRLPNDSIYFNGINIKEYKFEELRESIIVVFDEPFKTTNVYDELSYYLKALSKPSDEIKEKVEKMILNFELTEITHTQLINLPKQTAYLIKILRYLIIEPEFLAIDSIFSILNNKDKKQLINIIKNKNITLLNVTTDLEDSLLGNKLYVLENFILILEGGTLSVLKTDTLLKRLGFKLPFTVDLSIELNHYDVLNKIYIDKKKLVSELWK